MLAGCERGWPARLVNVVHGRILTPHLLNCVHITVPCQLKLCRPVAETKAEGCGVNKPGKT